MPTLPLPTAQPASAPSMRFQAPLHMRALDLTGAQTSTHEEQASYGKPCALKTTVNDMHAHSLKLSIE